MHTVLVPFDVSPSTRPAVIRALRQNVARVALGRGRAVRASFFSAIDNPSGLLVVIPGIDCAEDPGWLTQGVPPGSGSGPAIACRVRHWYWNASLCAEIAAFTLIEAAPAVAAGLIRAIDQLARTGLATMRGFVDFQVLQGVDTPGYVGVLHEWQTGDLLAEARHDTAEALDRITADAGARAIRYVAVP